MAIADIWVVPTTGASWGLKLELASETFAVRATKAEAVTAARSLARESRCALIVLDDEGNVESRESFIGVPPPPKA